MRICFGPEGCVCVVENFCVCHRHVCSTSQFDRLDWGRHCRTFSGCWCWSMPTEDHAINRNAWLGL